MGVQSTAPCHRPACRLHRREVLRALQDKKSTAKGLSLPVGVLCQGRMTWGVRQAQLAGQAPAVQGHSGPPHHASTTESCIRTPGQASHEPAQPQSLPPLSSLQSGSSPWCASAPPANTSYPPGHSPGVFRRQWDHDLSSGGMCATVQRAVKMHGAISMQRCRLAVPQGYTTCTRPTTGSKVPSCGL